MFLADDSILGRLENDEKAFKELVDAYYTPLCVYSVQYTDSLEVSEDIVQDFFVRFWEKKLYRTVNGKLKQYLFNSIRNASIDYLRKHQPLVFMEIEENAYITEAELEETVPEEQLQRLRYHLKQLSLQEYKILMEVVVHNKKYKEVAEELGISVNTVKTHLSNALKYLRSCKFITLFSLFSL